MIVLRPRLHPWQADVALLAQFAVLLVSVAFSAWLTYVELFVILAICVWCVASAVILPLLFAATAGEVVKAATQVGH